MWRLEIKRLKEVVMATHDPVDAGVEKAAWMVELHGGLKACNAWPGRSVCASRKRQYRMVVDEKIVGLTGCQGSGGGKAVTVTKKRSVARGVGPP